MYISFLVYIVLIYELSNTKCGFQYLSLGHKWTLL